jgi:hypothetical protein
MLNAVVSTLLIVFGDRPEQTDSEDVVEEWTLLLAAVDGRLEASRAHVCGVIGATATSYICAEGALARYRMPTEIETR